MFAHVKPEQKPEQKSTAQKKEPAEMPAYLNQTGIPDEMKSRFENLSGFSFDDVRVHYNSDKPAQLQALAYTQGNQVFVASGQEKHLGHELGHVVQQKQGRVKPTTNVNGVTVNDNSSLENEANNYGKHVIQAYASLGRETYWRHGLGHVTQLKPKRAQDPYEMGSVISPQVHHIIPYELIVNKFNTLQSAEDKREIKLSFMPDIENITFQQLHNISRQLKFSNADDQKIDEANWMSPLVENLEYKINGYGLANITVTEFRETYNGIKNGEIIPDEDSFWTELLDSYFEWSAGNLFYGPQNRAEPGGDNLNVFDSDAKYIRDEEHVATLQDHYTTLSAANTEDGVKAELMLIGAQNRNATVGHDNDIQKWYTPDSLPKNQLLLNILPEAEKPRKDFIASQALQQKFKTIPKQLVMNSLTQSAPRFLHFINGYKDDNANEPALRVAQNIPDVIQIVNDSKEIKLTGSPHKLNIEGAVTQDDVLNMLGKALGGSVSPPV